MLEVQTDGAAAERFQIIFLFDNAKTALTGAVFFMRAVRKLKFNEKEYKYIIDFIGRH